MIGATTQELQTSRDLKWEITGGSGDWRGNNESQVKGNWSDDKTNMLSLVLPFATETVIVMMLQPNLASVVVTQIPRH